MTALRLAAVLAALAAFSLSANTQATSLAPGVHNLELTGTVDQFPCLVGTCGGSLGGLGAASVTGLSVSGKPFSAVWPDPTAPIPAQNATGTLANLVDFCPAGGPTQSTDGSGTGSFQLTGGLLDHQGLTHNASLTGQFQFVREGGTGLVITVTGATVTDGSGGTVAYESTLVSGPGAGTFVVTSGVPTCGAPLASPAIRISGTYLAPQ
jgi:hypothetical protein